MNKIILTLSALTLATLSIAQISVPEVQKSLYGSVDATWCGNCGQFGIPATQSIYSQVGDKAVFFEMHKSSSSALHSPVATTLATAFGSFAQPQVTLNGVLQGNLNPGIVSAIVSDINANYNGSSADINAGFEWFIDNDSLYVTTNTKFFTELAGDFYTGVYVTEDSIWEFQANYDPVIPDGNIYHFHILRSALSTSAYGVATGSGTVASGQEIEVLHKMKVDPEWDRSNIHINTVVWRKDGSTYTFLNANNVGTEVPSSLSIAEFSVVDIEVYPNPASTTIFIRCIESTHGTIQIFNQQGAVVGVGSIENGISELNVSNLEAGMYFIGGVTSNGAIQNQKFIKK